MEDHGYFGMENRKYNFIMFFKSSQPGEGLIRQLYKLQGKWLIDFKFGQKFNQSHDTALLK